MIMPTLDSMLNKMTHERGIWIGDAAGTVDPLGGAGMSVVLSDTLRVAQAIQDCSRDPLKTEAVFFNLNRTWRFNYLHARFVGTETDVLGLLDCPITHSYALVIYAT